MQINFPFCPGSLTSPKQCRAFTLVETVIALGVVSFAMLGILGMVPLGLTNFREAMATTTESQIIQALSNDIQLTSYSKVVASYRDKTNSVYYDGEGLLLSHSNDPSEVFEVKISSTDLQAKILPSGSPSSADEAVGQTVQIEVRSKSSQTVKKYSFIVPKG